MEDTLLKTCLHDRHVALGALMSPFAGFDMPIQYTNITTSIMQSVIRPACSMCRIWVRYS